MSQLVPSSRNKSARRFSSAFVAGLIFIVSAPLIRAADGDLDPTFGNSGKVVTDFNNSTDWLSRIAVQPDGKIVAIGDTHPSHKGALARYNRDGTLDTSFGNGGKVITVVTVRESAAGLLILPDGKIMVSGSISLPSSQDTSFVLLRFNSDGSVDPTFGNGGMVTTNVGPVDDQAYAIALQPDGKIVAAGRRGIQIEPAQQRKGNVALARYNPDGSLDATFGNGGKVVNDFGQGLESYAIELIIQPDGKLIIAGESSYQFLVARYNTNGTLDSTFGGSGFRLANFSSNWDKGRDAVLQSDGKIIVVGTAEVNSPYDSYAIARFNSDGSFDQSFGNGGKVLMINQGDLTAAALESDGKLIALGLSNSFSDSAFHLLRFNANGTLDSTFGSGGTVTTDFGRPTEGADLVFQADGKLLAGGLTSSDPYFNNSDFALARYQFGSNFQLTGAVSRKTQGASVYGLALPLTGTAAIEPRSGGSGGEHQIVLTFPGSVTLSGATVTAALGKTAEIKDAISRSADGRTVTVDLMNVSDAQTITVTLRNVSDGSSTRDVAVPISLLRGDINGDGVVNVGDATLTRSRSGASADESNFRSDVNADGFINSADSLMVRSSSGTALP